MSHPPRRPLTVLAALLFSGVPLLARTIVVKPGESIRAALSQAGRGDRIQVLPGVYHEGSPGDLNALTITADGIELAGVPTASRPVVLENAGGQSFGIWVSPTDTVGVVPESDPEHPPCGLSGAAVRGFSLSGFTLRGFAAHGAHLACVDGFSLVNNVVDGNGVYGLFPVVSRDGIIAGNEVMNTPADAAIYLGQSDSVLIKNNRVHDSLLGIEIENSTNCAAVLNEIHDNTFGLFVDINAFLERKTARTNFVAFNRIHDNNRGNTAPPENPLSLLPPGIGALVIGADDTTVTGNTVVRNQFVGIGVVSFCLALTLQGLPCAGLDIEPNPDGNRIVGNFVRGNGTVPIPFPALDAFRADLAWDGTGSGNCWSANVFETSSPPALPACF